MPTPNQFHTTSDFYGVLFHELGHWTGNKKRLARDMSGRFGDEQYAAEELVAELTAALLCGVHSIDAEPRDEHAKYIKSWIKVLKNDKRAFITASSYAQKAADFLLDNSVMLQTAAGEVA
jgi:antirestriction protein ArdC